MSIGRQASYQVGMSKVGYQMIHVGRVEEGERKVIFEPEGGIDLYPSA